MTQTIVKNENVEIENRLGRKPNELEVHLFSAMWSEHCGYKYSKKYLSLLPKTDVVGADENAGGVAIGDHVVVFKVESHNHPCAVEPFQGAATGIGGIIRDIIAVGARPIALLDSLKFGLLKNPAVKNIFDGVVRGISAYGNSIGVPTVAGETHFDEVYTFSPLVNVMAVGILKKNEIKTSKARPGGLILLLGSYTGRDGIHGASFASKELSGKSSQDRPAVQIADPFMGKVLIEANLEILKLKEIICCQDCGAAGILSSTSEMAFKGDCGINLYLDKVHLKETDMQPWEIMLSETQERMVYVVEPSGIGKAFEIAEKYDIPVSIIGETTENELYNLYWQGEEAASLPPESLCNPPAYDLNEVEPLYINEFRQKRLTSSTPLEQAVEMMLCDPNFASKKWIYSQYDHTVGGRTSLKPDITGASGIWLHETGGIIGLTIDSKARQVFLDPFNGACNTVWEAYRNLVASGFEPMGITNCLNFGNPEKDEVGYQFANAVKGLVAACDDISIPVVSGNVSFYNESKDHRVYPTPVVGMAGYTESHENLIKKAFYDNETVFLLGKEIYNTSNIAGSLHQKVIYDFLGGEVDKVDVKLEKTLKNIIFEMRNKKILAVCIDVSEGGLFGALFKALLPNNVGFKGSLVHCNDAEKALFGEINGRYLISTKSPKDVQNLLESQNIPFRELGICTSAGTIEFDNYKFDTKKLFNLYNSVVEKEMDN